MITAAQDMAKTLKSLDVRTVFTLCADQTNSLLDALLTEGIAVVGARQESAAVHMADGWARATGKPGVAIVGGGPGFVNSVTGCAVAQSAATPVLIIAGQPAVHTRERNGHQILYQADVVRTLTKWSQEVLSPNTAAEFVYRGFAIAAAGKPGPVHLSIPVNVMDADAGASVYRTPPLHWQFEKGNAVAGDAVAKALEMIREASRPILVVGGGAWWEVDSKALLNHALSLGIPVFTTELARGLIPDDGDICFGYAHPSFNRTFRELRSADLIIMVGTEMNLHTGAPAKELVSRDTRIIQLHKDPAQIGIGRPTDVALLGSLEYSLQQLANGLKSPAIPRHREWLNHIRSCYAKHRLEWGEIGGGLPTYQKAVHPLRVCESLQRHYSGQIRVVIDGGDFVHWPRLYFQAIAPGHWMDGAEIGVLGASLPVGIGAQMGNPAHQTWVFIGDGGFGFYGLDLSTAVENNVAVKVILGNDNCWGVEQRLQKKQFGRTVAVELPDIEYHTLARSLGCKAVLVDDAAKLDDAVDAMVRHNGPFLLNIKIPREMGRPLMK